MTKRHRKLALVAALVLALFGLVHAELGQARHVRQTCRLGSRVAWHVVQKSAQQALEGAFPSPNRQVASSTGGLISDHDLFMLVEGARFWVEHDENLSAAAARNRLPVSYAYLDGYDLDRVALRRAITGELPNGEPGAWHVAPVLLGLPASPSVHDVAAGVVDDDPLLSVHTGGQILTTDVRTFGVRYALGCIEDSPATRATQIHAVEARVAELVDEVERTVGPRANDYTYARCACDLLADQITYAERDHGAQPHDNDVYGALVEESARCYGLCGALKLVLDSRGIPNYIADGRKPSGRHSWNMVWVNGSWRVCDLTLRINASLALEQNFYTAHHYVPDDDCRILELVYSKLVSGS